eukprot:gene11428-biopygen2664
MGATWSPWPDMAQVGLSGGQTGSTKTGVRFPVRPVTYFQREWQYAGHLHTCWTFRDGVSARPAAVSLPRPRAEAYIAYLRDRIEVAFDVDATKHLFAAAASIGAPLLKTHKRSGATAASRRSVSLHADALCMWTPSGLHCVEPPVPRRAHGVHTPQMHAEVATVSVANRSRTFDPNYHSNLCL